MDYAGQQGFLGSMDANTGDLLLGWDTDQFLTNPLIAAKIMLVALKYGGLAPGGVNFDAKVRRESFEPIDLFHAHVGAMDTFAKGLKIAAAIRAGGELAAMVRERYQSWDEGVGAEIEAGQSELQDTGAIRAPEGPDRRPTAAAARNYSRTSSTATCFRVPSPIGRGLG